jgi:hypothetical protein
MTGYFDVDTLIRVAGSLEPVASGETASAPVR